MLSCSWLHPAARLLIWLMLAIFLQLAAIPLIFITGFLSLLASAEIRRHWLKLFLRVRLLLLTLFLVFAYGSSADISGSWLPAWEGCLEAGQHVLRLLVFLGVLAWLLAPIQLDELMGGLWFLLRPCRVMGLPVDRSITRLSLVMACLENSPADMSGGRKNGRRMDWRQWLEEGETEGMMEGAVREAVKEAVKETAKGEAKIVPEPFPPRTVCFSLPDWRKRDSLAILIIGVTLLIPGGFL